MGLHAVRAICQQRAHQVLHRLQGLAVRQLRLGTHMLERGRGGEEHERRGEACGVWSALIVGMMKG